MLRLLSRSWRWIRELGEGVVALLKALIAWLLDDSKPGGDRRIWVVIGRLASIATLVLIVVSIVAWWNPLDRDTVASEPPRVGEFPNESQGTVSLPSDGAIRFVAYDPTSNDVDTVPAEALPVHCPMASQVLAAPGALLCWVVSPEGNAGTIQDPCFVMSVSDRSVVCNGSVHALTRETADELVTQYKPTDIVDAVQMMYPWRLELETGQLCTWDSSSFERGTVETDLWSCSVTFSPVWVEPLAGNLQFVDTAESAVGNGVAPWDGAVFVSEYDLGGAVWAYDLDRAEQGNWSVFVRLSDGSLTWMRVLTAFY